MAAGAAPAKSPADATQGADLVLLNLPTTDAVETAVFGPDGVASALRKPQILIDFSTIKVGKGKTYAERLQRRDRLRMGRRAGIRRSAGVGQWHLDRHGGRE